MENNNALTIVYDLRCLLEKNTTGVGIYAKMLLEAMLKHEDVFCALTWNAYATPEHLSVYAKELQSRYPEKIAIVATAKPNKIYNFLASRQKSEPLDLAVEKKINKRVDVVFMPDMRPLTVDHAKLITTVHDLSFERFADFFSFKTRLWMKLIQPQKLLARAHRRIAVSKFTQSELSNMYNIDSDVIYEGPGDCTVRTEEVVKEKYFLAIGTNEPRKNMHNLIKGFELFHQKCPEYKLKIAGMTGSATFKRVPQESHKWLEYCGYVTHKEKMNLYDHAAGVVYPSLYEGFGLPLLEAWQRKTPIAVSDIPVMREIGKDNCEYFNPKDPAAIARALESLTTATPKTTHDFSWEKAAQETVALMKSVVQE